MAKKKKPPKMWMLAPPTQRKPKAPLSATIMADLDASRLRPARNADLAASRRRLAEQLRLAADPPDAFYSTP